MFQRPKLGHGVGLRGKHFDRFLSERVKVDWVEVISENVMETGGRPRAVLEHVRSERPVVLHGVSLCIGSTAPLDQGYLKAWRSLIDAVEPAMVSDHLCWGRAGTRYVHDLLPMPFTEEALDHVVERVQRVQDVLGRQLVLENVSSYLEWKASELTEWDFLAEIAKRADCGLLVDVNNIYVSAQNHGFDPLDYLKAIPPEHVAQFHLAGHWNRGDLLIDTHEGQVSAPVWSLYAEAVRRFGRVPTLVEWDEGVPELEVLLAESALAAEHEAKALAPAKRAAGARR